SCHDGPGEVASRTARGGKRCLRKWNCSLRSRDNTCLRNWQNGGSDAFDLVSVSAQLEAETRLSELWVASHICPTTSTGRIGRSKAHSATLQPSISAHSPWVLPNHTYLTTGSSNCSTEIRFLTITIRLCTAVIARLKKVRE